MVWQQGKREWLGKGRTKCMVLAIPFARSWPAVLDISSMACPTKTLMDTLEMSARGGAAGPSRPWSSSAVLQGACEYKM